MGLDQILEFLRPILEAYAGKFGPAITIISIIGSFRVIFKPLMVLLETIAEQTKTKVDDEWLENFKNSKVYTTIIFVLDYILSLKLPVISASKKDK